MKRIENMVKVVDDAEFLEGTAREIYSGAEGIKALVWQSLHRRAAELLHDIKNAVQAEGGEA